MFAQVTAQVVRSGVVDSVHTATVVALESDGRPLFGSRDPDRVIWPRSCAKVLQAVAMVRAGLRLDGSLLALALASHSGERYHLDGVLRLLGSAGLGRDALQNTADLPMDETERIRWQQSARGPEALGQTCSGKHAAMLVTCRENGWPLATYREPDHPLQRLIADTIGDLTGAPVAAVGVDGCGAPVFAMTVTGLARAFSRVAVAAPGTPEGRVAQALRQHPEWVGGTGRTVTEVLRAVPGLIAKDGAEAVFAAALPDGRALALKVDDGGERAVMPLVVAALRRWGLGSPELERLADVPVLGHGERVGCIEVSGI